jgi:hypothetical protein
MDTRSAPLSWCRGESECVPAGRCRRRGVAIHLRDGALLGRMPGHAGGHGDRLSRRALSSRLAPGDPAWRYRRMRMLPVPGGSASPRSVGSRSALVDGPGNENVELFGAISNQKTQPLGFLVRFRTRKPKPWDSWCDFESENPTLGLFESLEIPETQPSNFLVLFRTGKANPRASWFSFELGNELLLEPRC